ncbi:hypothetical protein V1477_008078 [Vespula maculifrons]|uniref:Uncharacterized protein n=1 Tax=Vespula maculifrons TaxID=7453 RepID=A0ABD2CEZ8_VESMC
MECLICLDSFTYNMHEMLLEGLNGSFSKFSKVWRSRRNEMPLLSSLRNSEKTSTENNSNAHQELWKNFSGNWLFVIRFRIDCGLKMI